MLQRRSYGTVADAVGRHLLSNTRFFAEIINQRTYCFAR
jgi:hypothetical protein